MIIRILFFYCIYFLRLVDLQAQSERHDVIVGGSLRGDYKSVQEFNILTIELVPYAGYFITKGLQVGMGLGLGAEISTNKLHSHKLGIIINPQLRYYFYPTKRMAIFPYAGFFYRENISLFTSGGKYSSKFLGTNVGMGVPFYITDKLILEPSIGYRLEQLVQQHPVNYHFLEFRVGLVYTVFRKK